MRTGFGSIGANIVPALELLCKRAFVEERTGIFRVTSHWRRGRRGV